MNEELTFEGATPIRLDRFLKESFPDYSRSYLEKVIGSGNVEVNSRCEKKSFILKPFDAISINFLPLDPLDLTPVEMDIPILYEDEEIAVIYKNAGLVCHPAPGTYDPTLVHGLLYKFSNLEALEAVRPGIVHRLDKETSGVMVIAKTLRAHEALSDQFKNRLVKKTYVAVVHKNFKDCEVAESIGRCKRDRKKMAIMGLHAKEALTDFKKISTNLDFSLIYAFPHTGRTHQIRVHLESIKHPIVGDKTYGYVEADKKNRAPRTLLHAYQIRFFHPSTKQEMTFTAKIPNDFREFLEKHHLSHELN